MLFISWDIDETNGLVLNLGHAKMIDFLDLIALSFSTSASRTTVDFVEAIDCSICVRTASSYSLTLVHSYFSWLVQAEIDRTIQVALPKWP